jgi:hypothetical protein
VLDSDNAGGRTYAKAQNKTYSPLKPRGIQQRRQDGV